MINEVFDRDTVYWNAFYRKGLASNEPSLFAKYVYEKFIIENGGSLIELGCGNGRDSAFFLNKGLYVTAIDASIDAIERLQECYSENKKIELVCGDFVNYNYDEKLYNYCYSRFSLHAISEKQEEVLIRRVYDLLKVNGYFFIEVRSVHDELYGKGEKVGDDAYVWEGHFRRFARMGKLIERIEEDGFVVHEAAEQRNFAPYKNENPYIIRLVARKEH